MRLEVRKYLHDVEEAIPLLSEFSADTSFEDYVSNAMLRSAVERQFEIIGEALAGLAKLDPLSAARISDHRRIIAFRNVLIHGYAEVDDRLVWDVLKSRLPILNRDVAELPTGAE